MLFPDSITFPVTHKGVVYSITCLPTDALSLIQSQLEELTSVPVANQKLLYKGKKPLNIDEATVEQAGFKNGTKVQMLGSTVEEIGGLRAVEDENAKKQRILKERDEKYRRSKKYTASNTSSPSSQYRFHDIQPLPHLPLPETAKKMLGRLAADPAIVHVMNLHKFSVGLLTELAPHEYPNLLGLNQNAGQSIKLRIRTNQYDGFRAYKEIRRVLCHELTHNVWGDHDNNFKELNSQLNREVAEYEKSVSQGTHYLSGGGDVYEPSELEADSLRAASGGHVLGGGSSSSANHSREEQRRRLLEAATSRLRKEEEELEGSCGTSGPSKVADSSA